MMFCIFVHRVVQVKTRAKNAKSGILQKIPDELTNPNSQEAFSYETIVTIYTFLITAQMECDIGRYSEILQQHTTLLSFKTVTRLL